MPCHLGGCSQKLLAEILSPLRVHSDRHCIFTKSNRPVHRRSYAMETMNESVHVPPPAQGLMACPFCSARCEFVDDCDSQRIGVRCATCGASVPATHATREQATRTWNQRHGSPKSLATIGGAATKGVSTARKRTSSRRNLRKARKQKRLNQVKAKIEESYARLQDARKAEAAEIEAASARSRSRLAQLAPMILADPTLRQIHDLLLQRLAADD